MVPIKAPALFMRCHLNETACVSFILLLSVTVAVKVLPCSNVPVITKLLPKFASATT